MLIASAILVSGLEHNRGRNLLGFLGLLEHCSQHSLFSVTNHYLITEKSRRDLKKRLSCPPDSKLSDSRQPFSQSSPVITHTHIKYRGHTLSKLVNMLTMGKGWCPQRDRRGRPWMPPEKQPLWKSRSVFRAIAQTKR